MSKNRVSVSISGLCRRIAGPSFLIAGLLAITSPASAVGDDPCAGATTLVPDHSLRSHGEASGEPLIVKLELPAAGLLLLDVTAPWPAAAEAMLGLATACGPPPAEPAILERSASHLLLVASAPGAYFFRLAAQDPEEPLGEVTLRSGFAADNPDGEYLAKGGEDEEEIEIEPDPLVYEGRGGAWSLASRLEELCRRASGPTGEVDDHGDSFPCATLLTPGREMAGELRNGWGDDADVFHFVLGDSQGTELWTVEIETRGEVDAVGRLYDHAGRPLAAGEDSDGGGFRLLRTLPSGAYFVRLTGHHGAEGFYTLRLAASLW